MDWQATLLSLRLAAATTAILLVVGVPVAYWLSISRFAGKWLIEGAITLPLVLPPTVLGFYFLIALGPASPFGRLYEGWTGARLPFSFSGLLLGSVLYSLPFAVQPFLAAFSGVDHAQVEASWCLGASRFRTFHRIVLPLSYRGILSGAILCFAHAIGEFGIVLMIGGNIPGSTRTLSIALYDSVQELDYESAGRNALFLLAISFTVLAATALLRPGARRRE